MCASTELFQQMQYHYATVASLFQQHTTALHCISIGSKRRAGNPLHTRTTKSGTSFTINAVMLTPGL